MNRLKPFMILQTPAQNLGAMVIPLCLFSAVSLAAEPEKFATGTEFAKQLNRPLMASRDYSPLRSVLDRFAEDRRIAICLDRRIDPGCLVLVDLQAAYFDVGIETLISKVPAKVVVFADTLFVTSPRTAETLRTRMALAERELEKLPKSSLQRQLELSRKVPMYWEALTSPRDLLVDFAHRFDVTIQNPDEIPHDLWARGQLPSVDLIAGVMFVAAQFDRDLKWIDSRTIQLVPQNPDPQLEQDHVFRGRTQQQVAELLQKNFPDRKIRMRTDRFRMSGKLEEHEAVEILLGNRAPRKASAPVIATTLANRRFTLRMVHRPFFELLGVLEKQGIEFERNTQQLEAAGIDFHQQISLELENATIEKLLTEACTPLGLAYQIEGTRVELGLAPRPVPDGFGGK